MLNAALRGGSHGGAGLRHARLFLLPASSSSCLPSSALRHFSSSSEDDDIKRIAFQSVLGPPALKSPFEDPKRRNVTAAPPTLHILTTAHEQKHPLSTKSDSPDEKAEEKKIEQPPIETIKTPPTPVQHKSDEEIMREVAESIALSRKVPITTNKLYVLVQRLGLAVDPNASEEERKRQRMARNTKIGMFFVCGSMVVGFITFCFYYGRVERDSTGRAIQDEYSGQFLAPFYRIAKSFREWRDYVVEPSREKLLPDPLPPGYIQPKYTVCIEMKNVLVSPEWTYKTGYRFKQRAALEYFLDVVGYPNFEVVIYTSENSMTAHPVVDMMDPKNRIMYRLYRDCTKYMNGSHVKDLNKLNRDLSKVILIDFDPKAYQLNPENVLRVPKWEGDMADTSLVDLAELLKTIHLSDVEDVRPVLQYYSSFDDPAKEFRRRAIYLAEQEQASKQQKDSEGQSLLKRYSGRLFGFRRHSAS